MVFSQNSFAAAGDENHELCAACEESVPPLYFCNACDCTFCAGCWDLQVAHRNKRRVLHEKTAYAVVQKVRSVISPPTGEVAQEELFREDANTAWFGIEREREGPLIFQDYGKYAELLDIKNSGRSENREHLSLNRNLNGPRNPRTPSLVSFVGQTGAGKSTVIKFLIEFYSETAQKFAAPVVGEPGANVPSSEDVHLYMDPLSSTSNAPVLYADCEGLEGGEREPLGARFKRRQASTRRSEERGVDQTTGNIRYSSELELTWANSSTTRSREFAVSHLYPRLLYTFSDVIVFVLRNPRVVEGVFQRLIEWAAAALEKSSNQPILPHAVIVLNDSPLDIDPVEWDIDVATERLLASLEESIFQNVILKKYVQFWRERGRQVEKVEDLLLAYYSSLQVLRFPANGRPNLMKEQAIRLHSSIQWGCVAARQRKAALRMLLDSEELQSYLQCAFEHYAKTLDFPFDFVKASFTLNPIPLDFGGNILKLALNLMDLHYADKDARVVFQKLSYMVASCIMLDSVRHRVKGTADHIFPQYLNHLDAALITFCARHWPCEFTADDGSKCVNVRSGHGAKGHQNKSGKVLAVGNYVSHFSFESSHKDFQDAVYFHLEELLGQLQQGIRSGDSQDAASARIHKDVVMARFYSHTAGDQASAFHSYTVCFSCLCEPPQHPLPCGHVLCTSCIKSYGRANNKTLVELDECPMESHNSGRHFPYTVYLKPKAAGVRILALDGGGIRGIIQIEILRMVERAFHGLIPVQYFFDLIIGDGTSGVFALGLAARHWSVEECAENFGSICSQAFMRRAGGNIPGISWFVDNYKSKFQSRPLQKVLIDTLSANQPLFGGCPPKPLSGSDVKVAVTATSHGGQAVVLANYNRQYSGPLPYHFYRSDKSSTEFKIWEAARATSATIRLFKPFHHEPSKQFFENDPLNDSTITVAALEWRAIWQDLEQGYPDILLSIGTGYNLSPQSPTVNKLRKTSSRNGTTVPGKLGSKSANKVSLADRQSAWAAYMTQLPDSALMRFIRLNPEFSEDLPAIDDVGHMKSLQHMVREHAGISAEIRRLIPRLLASLFYFELSEPILEAPDNSFVAKGDILCRLPPTSPGIRGLGKFIKENSNDEPCFLIRDATTGSMQCIKLGAAIIDAIRDRQFVLGSQTILFSSKDSVIEVTLSLKMTGYGNAEEMISGFPRSLFSDESSPSRQCQSVTTSSERRVSQSDSCQEAWAAPDMRRAPKNIIIKSFNDSSESSKGDSTISLQSAPGYPAQHAHSPNPSLENINVSANSMFRPPLRSPVPLPGAHPSATGSAKSPSQRVLLAQLDADREPAELDADSTAKTRSDCGLDAREMDFNHGSRPEDQLAPAQSHRLGTFGQDQLGQSLEQDHWIKSYGEGRTLAQDRPIRNKTTEQPEQYRLATQSRGISQPKGKERLTAKHSDRGFSQTKPLNDSQEVETAPQKDRGAQGPSDQRSTVATQQPSQLSRKLKEIGIFGTAIEKLRYTGPGMGDEVMSAVCRWGKCKPSPASYYVVSHGSGSVEWPQDADPDTAILIYRLIFQHIARKDKAKEERVRDTILTMCSQDSNPESVLLVYELFEQDLERAFSNLTALLDDKQ